MYRHRGGGDKHPFRKIDEIRDKQICKAVVKEVEYDPHRSAKLALLEYEDGEKR